MIILDTNIVSELMKVSPEQQVVSWMDEQDAMTLFITSITVAEISYGLSALVVSKRRNYLEDAFEHLLVEGFMHRILDFDQSAAHMYGHLMAHRKNLGRPFSIPDGQIAAITRVKQMSLATRNTCDFLDCDLTLINPFE